MKFSYTGIQCMKVLAEGQGELHAWMHPDEARRWMRDNKVRALVDRRMTIKEAVERFTKDGDYFAMGGFGHIRLSGMIYFYFTRRFHAFI